MYGASGHHRTDLFDLPVLLITEWVERSVSQAQKVAMPRSFEGVIANPIPQLSRPAVEVYDPAGQYQAGDVPTTKVTVGR